VSVDARSGGLTAVAAGLSYVELHVLAAERTLVLLLAPGNLARRPDRPRLPLTDAFIASNAKTRPPMRCAGRRGRPPQLLRQMAAG
jgi:hypothetical protein